MPPLHVREEHWEPIIDVDEHNARTRALLAAYGEGTHDRVPITLAFDEQFLLPRFGCSFARYYSDASKQIEVQLRSQNWVRHRVLQDAEMGLPEAWHVCPPSWMDENELYGARIVTQEDDYAWGQPLPLSKAELLRHLEALPVQERITQGTLFRQHGEMKRLTEGMEYLGRPVRVTELLIGSTHGIFTKAAELRGVEQLCLDLHEDSAFVSDFLATMCRLTVERIRAWRRLCGLPDALPLDGGWGIADDSLTLISRATYEAHVLPHHQWLYGTMTRGTRHIHLCGHVQQLFKVLREELGITLFDGPGTQVDIPQMIDDVGTDVVIQAQVSHAFLRSASDVLRGAVARVLDDRAKLRVKMRLLGYAPHGAPDENLRTFYDAGLEYGRL
jgi:hypothetical protein